MTPLRPAPAMEAFIRAHTRPAPVALVPEISLYLADEITPLWQACESWLRQHNISPPFWAFAWPGGQILARYIIDHPESVRGRSVLDFGCGSGLAAIACAMAGAARTEAVDIDPMAAAAATLNAALNRVELSAMALDIIGQEPRWDMILCGDICYEAPMTRHIMPWLRRCAATTEVWLADPGRSYLPTQGLEPLWKHTAPTSRDLEDSEERPTTLFRLLAPGQVGHT